jgi:aspartate/tyrosine/aromatic aminotransferase
MADVVALAQDLWDLAWDDAAYAATLEEDAVTLTKAVAAGTNTGDVVSASKNGATYTMRPGFTVQERLRAMRLAIKGLKHRTRPSRNRRIVF